MYWAEKTTWEENREGEHLSFLELRSLTRRWRKMQLRWGFPHPKPSILAGSCRHGAQPWRWANSHLRCSKRRLEREREAELRPELCIAVVNTQRDGVCVQLVGKPREDTRLFVSRGIGPPRVPSFTAPGTLHPFLSLSEALELSTVSTTHRDSEPASPGTWYGCLPLWDGALHDFSTRSAAP